MGVCIYGGSVNDWSLQWDWASQCITICFAGIIGIVIESLFYFQNLWKEEEGHNSQKWRSHAISFNRITLPDNVQMGSSTNVGFSYFYLAFLSLFFKAGRFSLSFPYSAVHPGYKLHVQYPEYTISPQSKCPFKTVKGKHYIQTFACSNVIIFLAVIMISWFCDLKTIQNI